jgi:2-polyprenyl-3-methyl-5-hydroxy-6-metoxy-1,4-benzoquinol methylase
MCLRKLRRIQHLNLMNSTAPRGITFQPDIYPKALSLLPPPPARVLDVGSGEGYFCKLLVERGYQVEACDYSEVSNDVTGVTFTRADLNQKIPLPDNAYDVVVSIEVIEHIENHVRFVQELMRVTRPGGMLLLTTPNIHSIPSRWHFFLYGYTDCAPRPLDPHHEAHYKQHINPISIAQMLYLIERFGGELTGLHTNRIRRSARIPMLVLYPIFWVAIRLKLLRRRFASLHTLYRRHMKWVLHPANLLGRITIAVATKRSADGL